MVYEEEETEETYCGYCGETHDYCRFCGEDLEEGHSNRCPLISGVPEEVQGVEEIPGNREWNLRLGRLQILLETRIEEMNQPELRPEDELIEQRLWKEEFSYRFALVNSRLIHLYKKVENTRLPPKRWWLEKKLKKAREEREDTLADAKGVWKSFEEDHIPFEKIEEIFDEGRFVGEPQ